MVDLYSVLDAAGVRYRRFDHAPVFTCDDAYAALPNEPAVQTKNLFLRDKRGRRHALLVTSCEKAVDIKRFAKQIDADHLSFASAERMMTYLGVTPGSVTVLGLINDPEHAVELYVDADVWRAEAWRCHPLINSATLVIARQDVEKLLAHTGHTARVVTLESRDARTVDASDRST
ncbi:MAG TPA: prolyl-tRNA synthetase associated domain-containing protein [Gemmatimonadaceae bacterium]|jgi:Ala-tRNA(Pro) deacylase|nr:prolyl-tRNA synthetase associated domain-containing protein [Gemmatimonadaceae bacterium]